MTDAFAQVVGPVLQHALGLLRGIDRGEQPPLDSVRDELVRQIDGAEQRAAPSRELASDFELAKRALVYWIDEALIHSKWSKAQEWRNHILEWEYYRENLGGDRFFEFGDQARQSPRTDALEVFYLCVALGFQGRLVFDRPALARWAGSAHDRLMAEVDFPERFLPDDEPGTFEPLRPLPGKSALLKASILSSATALMTVACLILANHLALHN